MSESSVLQIRPFRDLWLGQAISQLGDAFYSVTFLFMVQKVTGSLAMVGYVGALESLPFLLFGPYAGVIADRLDRRRIMLASDVVSGLVMLLLTLAVLIEGKPPVWLLLVVPFLLSSVRCFFMPAKSAAIPSLVPADLLLKANSLSSATQTFMPIIALSLSAGVLSILYTFSPQWFYSSSITLNALSFLASAFYIRRLPAVMPDRKDVHEIHPFVDFKEGLRYVKGRHDLVMLTIIITIVRFAISPFFVVYLAANKEWFGNKPQTVAWFELSFFSGLVVASAAMGKAKPNRPMIWFSSGMVVVGAAVAAMSFSPWLGFMVLWNVIAGLALPVSDLPVVTYIQTSVPNQYQGRVSSVREMIANGVMPISMCLAAIFVARYGIKAGFLAMGLGMAAASMIGFFDPILRNAKMPGQAAPDLGIDGDLVATMIELSEVPFSR